ncbi:PH-domain-containing protein [Meredithblackwellia eburnea MCA 4105]
MVTDQPPTSPRAAPPSQQEIQRRLGAPADVVPSSLQLPPPVTITAQTSFSPPSNTNDNSDLARKMSASRRSIGSSGLSSADEDEFSPSSPNRPGLPLSAISELEDNAGSASDSDASSVGAGAPGSARGTKASHTSAGSTTLVDRGVERLRISGEGTRMSDDVAFKSGYLMKKGERRKAWKRRWFVLRGGQVAMYKNDKEYQLLRLIPLTEIHTCAPIEFKKHAHTFGIVTPRRTYYVKATSDAEVQDWCSNVERAKEEMKALATVTSVETPTPGDVTPSGPIAIPTMTSTASQSIPIPQPAAASSVASRTAQGVPQSYTTTATSPSPPTPFSPTSVSGNSVLSSSFTSTSTGIATLASNAPPSGAGTRVPPNSFAAGGAGALGLQNSDGQVLELRGVDAGLESIIEARQLLEQQEQQQEGMHRGGSSSGGEASSNRLQVPGQSSDYFGFASRSSNAYTSPGGSGLMPSSPGGGAGVISSSEDEDGFDDGGFSPVSPTTPAPMFQQQQQQFQQQQQQQQPGLTPQRQGNSAFGDPNKVILSGYLMKQGKRKNWRKRWFVLLSGGLMYSRSHMDSKIHRQIPLSRILDAIEYDPTAAAPQRRAGGPLSPPQQSPSTFDGGSGIGGGGPGSGLVGGPGGAKNYENCFKIITPKRTYLVCAPTEEDEIAWLAALQCLVQRKQASATTPAAPTASSMPSTSGMGPKRTPSSAGTATTLTSANTSTGTGGGGFGAPTEAQTTPRPNRSPPSFEVRRDQSTSTATRHQQQPPQQPTHGRQRSVTDAARAAVREGVASFRDAAAGRSAEVKAT